MVRSFSFLSGFAFLALPAAAQSINVDFGPAGSPLGVPSPAYGASNGKAGVWNKVSALTASNLLRWDGTPTNVSVRLLGNVPDCPQGNSYFITHDFAATSGDDAVIFDEMFSAGDWDENMFRCVFEGLEAGDYVVDAIFAQAGCSQNFVTVAISTQVDSWGNFHYVVGNPGPFVEGADYPPPPGSNFTRYSITTYNGRINVVVGPGDPYSDRTETLCAVQIDKVGDDRAFIGTPLCFGDGSSASCPCGNSGASGTGCQNSAGTGGSWLSATGAVNPDTVVLHVAGELPSALSVFLQGNSVVGPFLYGDGLRCAGGTLRRLYAKHASSGVVVAPEAGDPSIATRSAALGVPISPGGRRYYQVFYRDPSAAFCPQGSTFNVSNAVKIDW